MTENTRLIKERKPLRSTVTRFINSLTVELDKEDRDLLAIDQLLSKLRDKHTRLGDVQMKILEWMIDEADVSEEVYDKEFNEAEDYRERFRDIEIRAERILRGNSTEEKVTSITLTPSKYNLPVLELKKFTGEIGDWLGWWSHYQTIHEDKKLTLEIKFQYLLQSMTVGSRAANLVNSFPPTAENYGKAIDQLKERFGREDLLVEYYVRELQSMVIDKSSVQKNSESLCLFYDRLETHLRALESLGMAKDKTAYFLKPLVENCLPDDTLRLWQRKREETESEDSSGELERLMAFIRSEVNNEDRIQLVRGKSKAKVEQKTSAAKKGGKSTSQKPPPTTASLTTTDETPKEKPNRLCVFCDKEHSASECFKARKMTLSERKEFLKQKRACMSCLRIGHLAKNCRSWVRCMLCNQRHYTLMCTKLDETSVGGESSKASDKQVLKDEEVTINNSAACSSVDSRRKSEILLQTIIVKLVVGGRQMKVRALLDSGSQRSYVSQRAVQKLKPNHKGRETVIHSMLGGIQTAPQTEFIYAIIVGKIDGTYKLNIEARGQEKICGQLPSCSGECLGKTISKELGIYSDPDVSEEIDLLIGAEYYCTLQTGNIKMLHSGLAAVETRLGWTVIGSHSKQSQTTELIQNALHSVTSSVENLWKLDVLGIEEPSVQKSEKDHHQEIMNRFHNTIRILKDGRYEVELPWKDDCQPLSDNKGLAKSRLERMKKGLAPQQLSLHDYMAVFQIWLDEKIIEEVPRDELNNFGHYLPHRPVVKSGSATTKIRPVFDASAAKRGDPSLNDCMEKGPNLIEEIPNVLDRFRSKAVAASSDIEKAFLQISITKEHRDYLRFFSPTDNRIFRHCRVVFGVSSSPFLLAAVINYHLDNVSPELQKTATKLRNSFYVDNCLTSFDNEAELQVFKSESQFILQQAKMNLRGWTSNAQLYCCASSECREIEVLGMKWNLVEDTLSCNISNVVNDSPDKITKRIILSTAQKLYDPIGFTAPVTLLPKLIMQKLWEIKIGWDDELTEEWSKSFEKWRKTLPYLEKISISRLLVKNPEYSLHIFVDASKDAYAACIFLRSENTDGKGACLELVRAKSRVSPKKKLSIPRLELMACCIGARLVYSFTEATGMQDVPRTYWSDSTTALWWIQHPGPWTVFVDNRVQEIKKLSTPRQWRHVPGSSNPADLPSRGCDGKQLLQSEWWKGPAWLVENEDNWPVNSTLETADDQVTSEQKIVSLLSSEASSRIGELFKNISSYRLILKVVAWIKRFCFNSSLKSGKRQGALSTKEIKEAEVVLFRQIQKEPSAKKLSMHPDTLFYDENGLLRVRSKVVARRDTEYFRYPIVLFGDHPITLRLIEDSHRTQQHAGTHLLGGLLRERFFILGGRRCLRRAVNNCGRCRRFRAKPFESAPVHLPEDRVMEAAVFEISGVDYFGPVYLRDGSKAWVSLFTCAIYRAIHFELVSSLSTETYLLALRRFISRRGRPRVIYSDNGSNFVGARNALKDVDWIKIQSYTSINQIEWKFNPPTASWWGGWWERLVRVIKDLLKRTLGRSSLNYEEMQTILCDAEITINSRPLTYLSEDTEDMIPLTPALFLNDTKGATVEDIDAVDRASLNRLVKYKQRLSRELRQRFRSEYLGKLFEQGKKKATRAIKEGEIVLIGNPKEKRVNWSLGKVIHLFPGKDGAIRKVRVKTSQGVLERPIQNLYPMEVSSADAIVQKVKEICTVENSEHPTEKRSVISKHQPVHKKLKESVSKTKKLGESGEIKKQNVITRIGRVVQVPKRLDLLDYPMYCFSEAFPLASLKRECSGLN